MTKTVKAVLIITIVIVVAIVIFVVFNSVKSQKTASDKLLEDYETNVEVMNIASENAQKYADWLVDFFAANHRNPTTSESESFWNSLA